jgi:hypothetical protein
MARQNCSFPELGECKLASDVTRQPSTVKVHSLPCGKSPAWRSVSSRELTWRKILFTFILFWRLKERNRFRDLAVWGRCIKMDF